MFLCALVILSGIESVQCYRRRDKLKHGVQRRMISVDNFFVFLRLLFLALLSLYVT